MARNIFSSLSKIKISLGQLFLCVSIMALLFYCFSYSRPMQGDLNLTRVTPIPVDTGIEDDDPKGSNETIASVESPKGTNSNDNTIVSDESPTENNIDDPNNIVLVDDDLSNPPRGTVQERIKWFLPRIANSKILESTATTRKSHGKIMEFLGTSNCKVLFFMTWISPKKLFRIRDLLALESIFKSHPDGCAIILSKSMGSVDGTKILEPLVSQGYKLLVVPPDFHALFSDTPAQKWLERLEAGSMDPGRIPITQNLSNLLRLVALYKYGGVYIDTDVIIIKDVSSLRNAVGIQSMENPAKKQYTPVLNNAVLIFDKGHPTLLKFIEEFALTYNGNKWGHNGPALVTRVVYKKDREEKLEINVLPIMAFYPVGWFEIIPYFKSISENGTKWAQEEIPKLNSKSYGDQWFQIIPVYKSIGEDGNKWVQDQLFGLHSYTYGIHLWNTGSSRITIEHGSIIGKIISDHCIMCKDIFTTPNVTKT